MKVVEPEKAIVAISRQLSIDLWRLFTEQTTMDELGLIAANLCKGIKIINTENNPYFFTTSLDNLHSKLANTTAFTYFKSQIFTNECS